MSRTEPTQPIVQMRCLCGLHFMLAYDEANGATEQMAKNQLLKDLKQHTKVAHGATQ